MAMPQEGGGGAGEKPLPALAKLSRKSGALGRASRGLERGSAALDKRSIKAIARNSRLDSGDWVVDVPGEWARRHHMIG